MPTVFSDFPSSDSCLRCRGEERCSWHSSVQLSKDRSASKSDEKLELRVDDNGNIPNVVANLPPELYYNYNPSRSSPPIYRVFPTPTRLIWEEGIKRRLSLALNPDLKKTYDGMRQKGELGPYKFPSIHNFRFQNNHVRYVEPKVKVDGRLWRSDNRPRPKECGKSLSHMEIHPYSDSCDHVM